MKKRNGFVSNSSSSSFVLFKEALSDEQKDKILDCWHWAEKLIQEDEEYGGVDNLKERFEYYDSDPWRIIEHDDYIFGETSMDNFNMQDYLEYIKIDQKFVQWDDGYNDEPWDTQIKFINKIKNLYRKNKINKLNNL